VSDADTPTLGPGRVRLAAALAVVLALYGCALGLQAIRERVAPRPLGGASMLYVRSGSFLARASLSYRSLAADLYWIRAIQHFGSTRLSRDANKRYDLLYPLLDIATSLDPRFSIAYRFGAIFLADRPPDGPGRPDLSIALLQKGLAAHPERWEYAQDAGFVYYWWLQDYKSAAQWFQRASQIAGAPWWLRSLAATVLVEGGDRKASRQLWDNIYRTADHEWLRNNAKLRLAQLDALDQIDALSAVVQRFRQVTGREVANWDALVSAGWIRGVPLDPAGVAYVIDPARGGITVAENSPLFPLPTGASMRVRPQP
jgi:hypothetical protein